MKPERYADGEIRRPVRKEQWDSVVRSIHKYSDVHRLVPFLMASSLWSGLKAYYGGSWRALWEVGKDDLHMWWMMQVKVGLAIWISDQMGWTKVYHYPETEAMLAHSQRHGWRCSGSPNCSDDKCIARSLPPWFRRLTDWHDG